MEVVLLLFLSFSQDKSAEVEKSIQKLDQAKSFVYQLRVQKKGGDLDLEGALAGEILWLKGEQGEVVRKGSKVLARGDGGVWKKARGQTLKNLDKFRDPRTFVRKLSKNAGGMKKEKSGRIGKVTVDIYVASLGKENVTEAFESSGMPLWGSMIDWTKTKNGVLFYVSRSGKDLLRVEVRKGAETPAVVIDLGDFNRARIPKEALDALSSDP